MTTKTDDIKLPPLPAVPAADHYSSTLVVALEQAEDAIRAAVEAYAKRIAELEAARIAYASEFAPNEDGEPDVGRIHENIRKLKADRQQREFAVAQLYLSLTDAMGYESESGLSPEEWAAGLWLDRKRRAEPVKVPSDEVLHELSSQFSRTSSEASHYYTDTIGFARALLSRYGSVQPAASAEPVLWAHEDDIASVVTPGQRKAANSTLARYTVPLYAAPVAQEPVSVTERWQDGDDSNMVSRVDTTAPVAAQAQPDELKSVLAAARQAGWSFEKRADGTMHMVPLTVGTAQAQPAMPPLTEAMRAVLRNEHDVYGDEDALYAALCDAAQAQPSAQDREDAAALRAILMESPEAVSYPNESWTEAYAEWRAVAIDAARASLTPDMQRADKRGSESARAAKGQS